MEQDIILNTDYGKKVMLEKWSDSKCFFIIIRVGRAMGGIKSY